MFSNWIGSALKVDDKLASTEKVDKREIDIIEIGV
jgi:hypothetical protein